MRAVAAALSLASTLILGCPADDDDSAEDSPCPWFEPQIEALGRHGLEELGYPGFQSEPDDGWADDGLDVSLDDLSPACVDIVRIEESADLPCGGFGPIDTEVTARQVAHSASGGLNEFYMEGAIPPGLWSSLGSAMRDSEWQGGAMWDCGDLENDQHTSIQILGHNENGEWWTLFKYYSSGCEDPATRELMDNDILDQWRTVEAMRRAWAEVVRPLYEAWWDENGGCPEDRR